MMIKRKSMRSVISAVVAGAAAIAVHAAIVTDIRSVNGSGETSSGIVLTVSAVEHQDGDVTGHAMFHDRHTGSKLSIDVSGIAVSGNTANVDGEVVRRTGDYVTSCGGSRALFAVQDNGEGNGAPVDRFTLVTCYDPGQGVMEAKPFESDMGNFQVRTQ